MTEQRPSTDEHADAAAEDGTQLTLGFWNVLTSTVTHTLAGAFFALPGLALAVLVSTAWPTVLPQQDLGYYLIGMVTLSSVVLLEDLGSTGESAPELDTASLDSGELLQLIVALLLSTSAMVSVRLLAAMVGAALVASSLGTSAAGLLAVATAISITAMDRRLESRSYRLSIGGLAGASVLVGMSLLTGLGRTERESLRTLGSRVGTAR